MCIVLGSTVWIVWMTFDITRPPDDADRSIWICENISDTTSKSRNKRLFTKKKSPKTGRSIQSVTRKLSRKTEEAKQTLNFLVYTREIQIISSKNSKKGRNRTAGAHPRVQVVTWFSFTMYHRDIWVTSLLKSSVYPSKLPLLSRERRGIGLVYFILHRTKSVNGTKIEDQLKGFQNPVVAKAR